ncbi:MAG: hypothetical protein V1872_07435 [bacterium]
MGTFYALGVATNIDGCTSKKALSKKEWEDILNERFDLELFDLIIKDNSIKATLKQEIFKNNIKDFFQKLKDITMSENVDYYLEEYGDDVERYQTAEDSLCVLDKEGNEIELCVVFALLFIEGKVSVEEFNIEPKLMNWLFRHTNFGNKLAGAIVSSIVG